MTFVVPEIEEREREHLLLAVMQTLSTEYKLAEIVLRYFYWGQSYAEIGQAVGLPKETVYQRFYKALRCLRHPSRITPLLEAVPWDWEWDEWAPAFSSLYGQTKGEHVVGHIRVQMP